MSDRNTFTWPTYEDEERANDWWALARSLDPLVWEHLQFTFYGAEGEWTLVVFTHGGKHNLRVHERDLN